ncbi:IPT/TIG domain-containing protein [Streptomyces sp. NBC_00536]|uniref:IPT/TIG domain-containing protein n=1 Tax=Streptomyces sp. NBC_00536 TaxID=2975769 RepID=UPI002E81EE2D|nr:IPT/TIG domain-containing protein [Streptomyces sp. NBC_00536]WUC83481.1 IPT/TIG domain-containing protein [Streptomyces sp. NBC_00536]
MRSTAPARPRSTALHRRATAVIGSCALALTGLLAVTAPAAQAVQPGHTTAYVTNFAGKAVSVVDTTTGATTASVPVAGYAQDVEVNPAGTVAYAATAIANTVAVIDTATATVTATIPLAGIPNAVTVNASGSRVYVADSSAHRVDVIDTATNTVTATVPVPGNLQSIDVNPAGTTVYVTTFSPGALVAIDTATNTVASSLPVATPTYGLVINPAGTAVYVATGGGNALLKVDTATNTVTASIPVTGAVSPAITPDGSKIYVTAATTGGVTVIDAATSTVTAFVGGLGSPSDVQVNSTGTTAYVADQVNPSGTAGNIYALDTTTNAVTTAATGVTGTRYLSLHTIAAPEITSVSPNNGPLASGTVVTITGTDLAGPTSVTFGGVPATGVSCTATSCTATAPAGTAGTVDVRVTTPGGTSTITPADQYTYVNPPADIDVNLTAQPHLGILLPYLTYTLTAHNTGPSAVTSATLTATLPPGAAATNLSTGCTTAATTVTCTYGAIPNGTSVDKTFRVPLSLLTLGHVTVTGVRTTSSPTDPNPANDSASVTCTAISIVLVTCP